MLMGIPDTTNPWIEGLTLFGGRGSREGGSGEGGSRGGQWRGGRPAGLAIGK
jgi:hypothetical protein